jgi:hypothetical protein
MATNQSEYEDIDQALSQATESIYLHPIFDGHDEVEST